MSNANYDLYIRQVFNLAKTLVVKSVASADAINVGLGELGLEVDLSSPATWKYYLNINGTYHSSDTVMTVLSMDTQEEIIFSKETLSEHRGTHREYVYGSRYFDELVRRYPTQESLILGILTPVELQFAVSAPDHTILNYDKNLVEVNEVNLIHTIQKWINGYQVRWNVTDYAITDDLYVPANLMMMYAYIPSVIVNARLAACKSNEAHSYHIREYLASNGKLDQYVDYLTKRQSLFLYRDILYLQRHAGKASTFELLVQRILSDRGIPLNTYEMRHNLSGQPENLQPTVDLVQVPLNRKLALGVTDTYSVAEILIKERPIAKSNKRVELQAIEKITAAMLKSKNDRLQTKILESNLVDLSDSAPFTLSDTLLNQWLWMSCNKLYPTILGIAHPVTGSRMALSAKDAFALMIYAANRAIGWDLEKVPSIVASRVRRVPEPSLAELKRYVDPKYVSVEILQAIRADLPPITRTISTESFFNLTLRLHGSILKQRELYTLQEHMRSRGEVECAVGRLYHDTLCNLGNGETYHSWLEARGLELENLSRLDYQTLSLEIIKTATGISLANTKSLHELQSAMLRLMVQLSSYSIQFLKTINSSAFKVADWAAIRLGDEQMRLFNSTDVEVSDIKILDMSANTFDDTNVESSAGGVEYKFHARNLHKVDYDPISNVKTELIGNSSLQVIMPNVHFDLKIGGMMDTDINAVMTAYDYNGLTYPMIPIEALSIKTLYDGLKYPWTPISWVLKVTDFDKLTYPGVPLSDRLGTPVLSGFDYPFTPIVITDVDYTDLQYPKLALGLVVTDFDALKYPAVTINSTGLRYPEIEVLEDRLLYPGVVVVDNSLGYPDTEGLQYPTLAAEDDGLEYPVVV